MRSARKHPHHGTRRQAAYVALALVAFVALAALLAACGGVEGTYKLTEGDDTMKDFTLTLKGDEFTLAGPNPLGGDDVSVTGSYTVDGDKISLKMGDGSESGVGTIDGNKLVFQDVTWEK